jgi:hypothetical protein
MSSLLAIRLSKKEQKGREALDELRLALADLPPDTREAAFWTEDSFVEGVHRSKDSWHRVFNLFYDGGIQLAGKDSGWVRKRLSDPNEPLDHREMMLWVELLLLARTESHTREFVEGLKQFVSDAPSLVGIIDNRLTPPSDDAESRRLEARTEELTKQSEQEAAGAHASWVAFWREIVKDAGAVFASDRAENTAWNLWRVMERSGQESRASGWNRRFIEAQFGKDVADRLRAAMLPAWRKDKPTLRSERSTDEKETFLVRWQFGLAAIAAQAEDPRWAETLTDAEAELACRYVPIELNGFPSWLEDLVVAHPAAVDHVLGEELSLSLRELRDSMSILLQNVGHASPTVAALFIPRIRAWLMDPSTIDLEANALVSGENLQRAVEILIRSGSDEDRQFLKSVAEQRLSGGLALPSADVWLAILLQLDPSVGVQTLETGLKDSVGSGGADGVWWFARLFGGGRQLLGVDPTGPGFTPTILLRIVRLAYQHVRIGDDAQHEGAYSPDVRDEAERGRNTVLGALLAATGIEGWAVKLEMANDPLFAHFRDRVIALAEERAAEEADSAPLTESEFAVLDKRGESPPSTRDAMFAVLRDRLDDIDDLLLQDVSPRESWASIRDERVLRRALAHELRNLANSVYTVDQEAVTADEKETDIRLRAATSGQQGTIELKIGEKGWSAADLRAAIKDQLLTKYMAADECRAGCLVVSVASEKHWKHPDTGERLMFEELIAFLHKESERLSQEVGGTAKLMAKGLDLRPRLTGKRRARRKVR